MKVDLDRKKGAVEILCEEIGFRFDRRMETVEVFTAFVRVLVSHIALMREMQEHLAKHLGADGPAEQSLELISHVMEMLHLKNREAMVTRAAEIHRLLLEPRDHLSDMLSSCVSAVRFGLDPDEMGKAQSRHAASAAQHIWSRIYTGRHDGFTGAWQKDWARAQLQEAILLMATTDRAVAEMV